MPVFSVDSDAVIAATATVRSSSDLIESETQSMLAKLTNLQASWTGGASLAFTAVVDQWRATQHQVEQSLASINQALATAGTQYAQTEQFSASLFR